MAATWFYMQDSKRVGPVALEHLKQMAADGTLRREDTVWTVGMNQWTPAGQVPVVYGASAAPALVATATTTGAAASPAAYDTPAYAPPMAAVAAAPVSYYDGGLPPRAAVTLKGHAPPTGDTGDWPVDDARVAQFAEAVKIRKKVTGAAQLYRALLLLSVIGLVIMVLVALGAGFGGGGGATAGVVMLSVAAFMGGLSLLYFFTWRATMRAHRWAPLTMMSLFLIAFAANVFSIVTAASTGRPEALIGGVFGMILPGIFAAVSWNSFAAIPRWRAQPAWCQELIVKSGQ